MESAIYLMSPYIKLFLAGATAFALTMLSIPIIIKVARKRKLLDTPDQRKLHTSPTPTLGGIGIFLGLMVAMAIFGPHVMSFEISCIVAGLLVLFFTGIRDDIHEISASRKFLIQGAVAVMVAMAGIRIESLEGIFGIHELPRIAQYVLTVAALVGITNAVNLLDGIDGLAGGIGLINALMFALLFAFAGDTANAVIAISLGGALLGFLRYNFNPAKIFMGDTGSLVLGFLMAVLAIRYLNTTPASGPESLITIFGILILPAFDTLRVMLVRVMKRKSPFQPDKNHIHHLLIKTGLDHKKAALIMYLANLLLIAIAYGMAHLHVAVMPAMAIILGAAILFSELLTIKRAMRIRTRLKTLIERKGKSTPENQLLNRITTT